MSARDLIPADEIVTVRHGDEGTAWAISWGCFVEENQNLAESGELDDVAAALVIGDAYLGGGGAAPTFTIYRGGAA